MVYDLPDDLQVLKKILQSQDFEAIYFKNEIAKPYYLTGYGSREQFAKLCKTIYQFPSLMYAISSKGPSANLKIDPILWSKWFKIFEELGFVSITEGVMTVNKEAEKKEIESSRIYQDLQAPSQRARTHGTGHCAGDLWLFEKDKNEFFKNRFVRNKEIVKISLFFS